MTAKLKNRRLLLSSLLLICLASNGCRHASDYKAPVGKFRDASGTVIEAAKVYLTELNKTERDNYIYQQASKMAEINLNEIENVEVFSKDAIAARLNALDQLANYADLLNQLANSDTPDKIKAKATDLKTSLDNLSGQVAGLTGVKNDNFKTVTGRVLPVIGEVLQAFADRKIEEGLKKAITNGAGPVNKLIQAIEVDMNVAFERKKSMASAELKEARTRYERERTSANPDPAKLRANAEGIAKEEDRWEAFLAANPTEGLEAMQTANDALFKFAQKSKPSVTDFSSFVDAVESFAATANRIGQTIQELRGK